MEFSFSIIDKTSLEAKKMKAATNFFAIFWLEYVTLKRRSSRFDPLFPHNFATCWDKYGYVFFALAPANYIISVSDAAIYYRSR
jgi:hypothetical protein